ncbi:MAG: hypothetical protein CL949_01815 [Erythrobacter sp.]|nr:hypothetical protein [Erythrobacter sp.]
MIAYRHNHAAVRFKPKPRKAPIRRDPRPRLEHPRGKASALDQSVMDRISLLIRAGRIGEADFGGMVNRGPNLVGDLYAGRRVRAGTLARIMATLNRLEGGAHE